MSDYNAGRVAAEYEIEMANIEARRGRYSNVPTEVERERERFKEWARKAETRAFLLEVNRIRRCAMYAKMQ